MKKYLIILLFSVALFSVKGQVYQAQQSYGFQYKRVKFDSTNHIPTFCGVPTLRGSTVEDQSAIGYDSCGHVFYIYDPPSHSWITILGGGGGGSRVDSLTFVDSVLCIWQAGESLCANLRRRIVYVKNPLTVDTTTNPGFQTLGILESPGLKSGGVVTSAGGLKIDVSSARFVGQNYISYIIPSTQLTANTADASLDRIDIVVADTLGNFSIIPGTPGATPQKPQANPTSQIELTFFTVPHGATSLNISVDTIYTEGVIPTNWDTTHTGTMTVTFRNTANPHLGTHSIFVSSYTNGSVIQFTKGGTDTVTSDMILKLFVWFNNPLLNRFQAQFLRGTTPVGNKIDITSYINTLDTLTWQNVSIAGNAFGLVSGQIVDRLQITMVGSDVSGAGGFYMDDISLQKGIQNNPVNLILTTDSTSGPATLVGNHLNVPNYSSGGGGTALANIYLKDSLVSSPRTVDLNSNFFKFKQGTYNTFTLDPLNDTLTLRINHAGSGGAYSLIKIGNNSTSPSVDMQTGDPANGQLSELQVTGGGLGFSSNSSPDHKLMGFSLSSGGAQTNYVDLVSGSAASVNISHELTDHLEVQLSSSGGTSGQTSLISVKDTAININTPLLRINGDIYNPGGGGSVTSVGTGYGLSGGTITTTGTLILDSATLYVTALRRKDSTLYTTVTQNGLKQNQLSGTGFVKASGTTISYDNSTYATTAANVLKLNITDTSNKWVANVTSINDSTIRIFKGTGNTDLVIKGRASSGSSTTFQQSIINGNLLTADQEVDKNGFSLGIIDNVSGGGLVLPPNSFIFSAAGDGTRIDADGLGNGIAFTAPTGFKIGDGGGTPYRMPLSAGTAGQIIALDVDGVSGIWQDAAGVPTSRTISTTAPLTGGGDLSANRTFAISNAVADGSTKGAASFTANDFDASSGNISIDYTNGQAASGSAKGFLTAADWTAFNGKGSGTVTGVTGTTNRITSTGGATPVIDISATFEALLGKVANPLSQFASTTSAQLAGVISDETGTGALVFGTSPTFVTPVLGTPTSGTLTNATGLPLTTGVTGVLPIANGGSNNGSLSVTAGTVYYGDGSKLVGLAPGTSSQKLTGGTTPSWKDTTAVTVTPSSTTTFTNKRWTARVGSTTSSATPTINTDNVDIYQLTAQAVDVTSFTTNLSGTPVDGDILEVQITGTAARAITWGASFASSTVTLPTTTVTTATLTVIFQFYTTSSYGNNKWVCTNFY